MVFWAGLEAASVAQCKGNIIIRISIKILFKSYLLIEYIPVTPQCGGQSFVSKKEKGLLNSLNRNQVITFGFISTCTFLWPSLEPGCWELFTILSPGCDWDCESLGPKKPRVWAQLPALSSQSLASPGPDWGSGHLMREWGLGVTLGECDEYWEF